MGFYLGVVACEVDDGMSYTLSGLSLERSITCAVGECTIRRMSRVAE